MAVARVAPGQYTIGASKGDAMKNLYTLIPAALLALPSLARAEAKSIYGDDNRQDYYEASAPMKKLADSVVSLWPAEQTRARGGLTDLATVSFGEAFKLCRGQKFSEQPIGAFCSGTLVGKDLVLTAGHCITDEAKCAGTKFVFGFSIDGAGKGANTTVPSANVYGCKKIVARDLDKEYGGYLGLAVNIGKYILNIAGPDYAVIQLDRPVEDRQPLPLNRKFFSGLREGDPVFIIGHPVGLPVKIAGDAKVMDTGIKAFFTADLDSFGGNSGSAVFNAKTKEIEGILVRGSNDFQVTPSGCMVQQKYSQGEGRGEAVTKVSLVKNFIPALGGQKDEDKAETRDMAPVQAAPAGEELAGKIRL
jgi:V8-like Glu-specific endopeptidase